MAEHPEETGPTKKDDPMMIVGLKRDIYKLERALEKSKSEEKNLSGKFHESIPTQITDHALVQFCDRIRPKQFDIEALRIFMFEAVAQSGRPVKSRKGKDSENEYFYEWNFDGVTATFLVKNNTVVTIWVKESSDE